MSLGVTKEMIYWEEKKSLNEKGTLGHETGSVYTLCEPGRNTCHVCDKSWCKDNNNGVTMYRFLDSGRAQNKKKKKRDKILLG